MTAEFNSWPDQESFDDHVARFQPFCALQPAFVKFPNPADLSYLDCDVNICSTDGDQANIFYGDILRQEHLRMKISNFSDAFSASESNCSHWIHGAGLNLYLSQATLYSCDLIAAPVQIVGLQQEVEIPIPLKRSGCLVSQINLWMNITPVRSALHYDQYNNILIVLRGRKVVSLVSPQFSTSSPAAYLLAGGGANHSLASSSAELLAAGSLNSNEIQISVLYPGDALFIPEGWWHDVVSDECSMALNFWFNSPINSLINGSNHTRRSHMLPYILRVSLQTLILNDMQILLESYKSKFDANLHNIDKMTHAQFELFMTYLLNEYSQTTVAVPEAELAIARCHQMQSNRDNMEDSLVLCSYETMARLWPQYVEKNPTLWGQILSALRPIAAYTLTNSWDGFKLQSDLMTDSDKFFERIFNPLQNDAATIRRHLVLQSDEVAKECCARIMKDVLGILHP